MIYKLKQNPHGTSGKKKEDTNTIMASKNGMVEIVIATCLMFIYLPGMSFFSLIIPIYAVCPTDGRLAFV